jgi:hypothetical protein
VQIKVLGKEPNPSGRVVPPFSNIKGVPEITAISPEKVLVQGKTLTNKITQVIGVIFAKEGIALANPAPDQSFKLEIAARSGDEIRIYGNGSPLSIPWILQVP